MLTKTNSVEESPLRFLHPDLLRSGWTLTVTLIEAGLFPVEAHDQLASCATLRRLCLHPAATVTEMRTESRWKESHLLGTF